MFYAALIAARLISSHCLPPRYLHSPTRRTLVRSVEEHYLVPPSHAAAVSKYNPRAVFHKNSPLFPNELAAWALRFRRSSGNPLQLSGGREEEENIGGTGCYEA